jgi:hypothetical protein
MEKKLKYYAGIGSRTAPEDALKYCTQLAEWLEKKGYILRTGGADGADKAFEAGVSDPFKKVILRPKHSTEEAESVASKIHPAWHACNEYARQLHGRNVQLILGENLDKPVDFVVAWTYDGIKSGGSRTGLVLAKQLKIPNFNLANSFEKDLFAAFLQKL